MKASGAAAIIHSGSDPALGSVVREFRAQCSRLDAAVTDPNWLIELLVLDDRARSGIVRLLSPPPRHHALPAGWRWIPARDPPIPEFLLAYRGGAAFPDAAIVFAGAAESGAWATVHRRPVVLDALRRRFQQLGGHPGTTARGVPVSLTGGSVREPPARRTTGAAAAGRRSASPAEVTAEELYRRILGAHFDRPRREVQRDRPPSAPALAEHQERAYERAGEILDRYGGVIVADAVGLGKTYVGLRFLEKIVADGGRGLVITPAATRRDWAHQLAYLVGRHEQEQRDPRAPKGGIDDDNLDLWIRETMGRSVRVLSTESLGRRAFEPAHHRADLLVVDEAHQFRNPTTRRYRNLSALADRSAVVLLTATPVNNSVFDLQYLIDLFAPPSAFRHLGIADYRTAFRQAVEGPAPGTPSIRAIITACVVRRTRRFVKDHYGPIRVVLRETGDVTELRFPDRRPPVPVRYDLAGTYRGVLSGLEDWIESLTLPGVARPDRRAESPEDPGASPVGDLLKIILLKRLESSVSAFRRTVLDQAIWCDTAIRALDAGRVLTRPDYRSLFRGPDDDRAGGQLAFVELMLPAGRAGPTQGERLARVRTLFETDHHVLATIRSVLADIGPEADDKLQHLIRLLDGPLAGRKVIIFTEFRDTARYLHRHLGDRPYVARVDSRRAMLGRQRASRREVIERFAPLSNGRPRPPERERVDLLISTDVLAEGLNLQDASVVVSYDLPWNPVRLIQRMGRIDRLGSRAEHVELLYFLPARELDRLLRLMERLRGKLAAIRGTVGLDLPRLAELGSFGSDLLRCLDRDTGGLDTLEREIEGPLEPEEEAYLDFMRTPDSDRHSVPGSPRVPAAAVVSLASELQAVAYWQIEGRGRRRRLWLTADRSTGVIREDAATAIRTLREATGLGFRPVDRARLSNARAAFTGYVRGVAERLEVAELAGDALASHLPQRRIAARLARSLEASLQTMSRTDLAAAIDPARIDDLLDRLGRRYTAAAERRLSRLADSLPDRLSAADLDRLDRTLDEFGAGPPGGLAVREIATLLLGPG